MDSAPVYTEPLRRESVEFVLAHAIRRPLVFMAARQHLRPEHFAPVSEHSHSVLWQAAGNVSVTRAPGAWLGPAFAAAIV